MNSVCFIFTRSLNTRLLCLRHHTVTTVFCTIWQHSSQFKFSLILSNSFVFHDSVAAAATFQSLDKHLEMKSQCDLAEHVNEIQIYKLKPKRL